VIALVGWDYNSANGSPRRMRRLLNRRSLRKEEENRANLILPVVGQVQDECSDFSLPGGEPPAFLRIFSNGGPDMQGDDLSSIHESVMEHQQPIVDTTISTAELDRLLAIPEDDEVSMMGESIKMGSKLKELSAPGSPISSRPRESTHLSDSGFMYQSDGHTNSTTIPSGNVKRTGENPVSSFVYVSLLMPSPASCSPINREDDEPGANGKVPNSLPPPIKVIERSIHGHLLLLFHVEEENGTLSETKRSLPVRVDDHSLLVCHDENVLNVVDSVVLSHLKHQDFSQALETYESLLHDLRRMETNPMLITPLLCRLSIVSLLVGQPMKALHYSAQILQRSQPDPASQLIARIQMGLTYFGLGDMSKALISWREASYKVGTNYAVAALLWNNIACLQYYTGDVKVAESSLKQSIALQKQLQGVPNQFRKDLLNTATTLSNLAIIEARQSLYVDAISHMEESLLLQESVLEDGSGAVMATMEFLKSMDDSQNEDPMTTSAVFVSGRKHSLVDAAVDSLSFLGSPVVFDEGFSLPRATKEHAPMVDYIDMGSLVHQLGPCQLVRDTIMDNFSCLTPENLSFVHDIQTKRLSIPIDVDGNEVIDAELHLPHIYIQAREHLEVS
jgi:tetratricopeptide (TPR) repeat protein